MGPKGRFFGLFGKHLLEVTNHARGQDEAVVLWKLPGRLEDAATGRQRDAFGEALVFHEAFVVFDGGALVQHGVLLFLLLLFELLGGVIAVDWF